MKPADSRSRCTYVKEEESKPRGARAASDLICIQTVAPFQFPRADDSLKTSIVRAASGIIAIISSLFQSEWLMEDSWIVGTQYEGGGKKKSLNQEEVWEGQMWWWPLTLVGALGWSLEWGWELWAWGGGGEVWRREHFLPTSLLALEICYLLTLCGCQSKSRWTLASTNLECKCHPVRTIFFKLIVSNIAPIF